VRIPSRRGDAVFFHRVDERLRACPAVDRLQVNAATGGVLIETVHALTLREALDYAEQCGLFRIGVAKPGLRARVAQRLRRVDEEIRSVSGGDLDLAGVAFVSLAGAALVQILRGEVLAPAATLLWYAAGILAIGAVEVQPKGDRNGR
jgi:hypothetical protein